MKTVDKLKLILNEFKIPLKKAKANNGILNDNIGCSYIGNELDKKINNELWLSKSDEEKNTLVLGEIGNGKVEALLGIAHNSLMNKSGFIYVDSHGDNKTSSKIYNMAKSFGREDDVLFINYMTGGTKDFKNTPFDKNPSNTFNPFATGTSSTIAELFTILMSCGSESDDIWAGRARSFITDLIRVLVWMRDNGEINMCVNEIRDHFNLDCLAKLIGRSDIPNDIIDGLRIYINTIDGMDKATLNDLQQGRQPQSQIVYVHHGYVEMQLTETINLLADDYGHIFKASMSEVDLLDVVENRRILIVLLPALEKSPASLGNLGKVVVAGLVSSLSSICKTKDSDTTFPIILDGYEHYMVDGSAFLPQRSRSLGISMVYAGKDFDGLNKSSNIEASSVIDNTNIKIVMGLEKTEKTHKVIFSGIKNSIVRENELVNQNCGEAYIRCGNKIIHSKIFLPKFNAAESVSINRFIKKNSS